MAAVATKANVNYLGSCATPRVVITSPERDPPHSQGHQRSQRSLRMDPKLEPVEEEMDTYEWPDLPPIGQMKNAIARQRVSQGVSYILPVHKTKSSVENVYRTNLRVMFQEPYLHEDPCAYDEVKLKKNVKHQFIPNMANPPLRSNAKGQTKDTSDYQLNAESEKVRRLYSQSAPSTGLTGKHPGQVDNLRQRSSLFLPIKAKIPPEAARLKAEADKILQSVDYEQEQKLDGESQPRPIDIDVQSVLAHSKRKSLASFMNPQLDGSRRRMSKVVARRKSSTSGGVAFATSEDREVEEEAQMFKKAAMFGSYDALKDMDLPKTREMPEELLSPYVSQEKASDIWQWLHHCEPLNDFTHFLQICS